MNETARLALPLLMPSQAQKHVTVNEALLRLDALSQLVLASRGVTDPPVGAAEGECYGIPAGATGAWSEHDGQIALFTNGGWQFVVPRPGWRAWIVDEGLLATFTGDWTAADPSGTPGGAGIRQRTIQIDHAVTAGAQSATEPVIPNTVLVYGITGRVTEAIGGAASFGIGVPGAADRYGSGIGTGAASWLRGLTSSPLAYWGETPLLLTAEGDAFDGTGSVRFAVHLVELSLPD